MSRDLVSEEWAELLLKPHRDEFDRMERTVEYVRREAFREGLTAHLRHTFQTCPFCYAENQLDLPEHLVTCEEVPEHLRTDLPHVKRAPE